MASTTTIGYGGVTMVMTATDGTMAMPRQQWQWTVGWQRQWAAQQQWQLKAQRQWQWMVRGQRNGNNGNGNGQHKQLQRQWNAQI